MGHLKLCEHFRTLIIKIRSENFQKIHETFSEKLAEMLKQIW